MTQEETREKLANFMGWTAVDLDNSCGDRDCCGGPFPMWTYCTKDENGEWMGVELASSGDYSGSLNVDDWQPDKDRNQLALVLEKVAKMGESVKNDLVHAVIIEVQGTDTCWCSDCGFQLITTPPETICQAILKVIESEPQ